MRTTTRALVIFYACVRQAGKFLLADKKAQQRGRTGREGGLCLKQREKHREHVMGPLTKVLTLTLIAALGILAQAPVQAAEITVLAGMGNVSGIQDLAPAFERASGHKVIVRFVPTADLPAVIAANTPADVLTASPQAIDDYIAKGKVMAGTHVDFGKAGVGVSVKAGAPKPDIGNVEAFKRAMLNAKSIGYSNGGSGLIAAKVMEKLGIAAQLKDRTKFINGRPVAEDVAKGEVEIGIQQINVLLPVAGADYVGPLPGELQDYVLFSTGVLAVSKQVDAASAFQKFAAAPESAALLRKSGMEPWHGGR
jgi:molybdate transport system substrate-binding protein